LPRTVPAVNDGHLTDRVAIQYLPQRAGHRDHPRHHAL